MNEDKASGGFGFIIKIIGLVVIAWGVFKVSSSPTNFRNLIWTSGKWRDL